MTGEKATPRLRAETVNLGLFLVAVATVAVVVNFFATRPWLRVRVDATKTRAYSLSPQTRQMLDGLSGDWTVAVVAGAQRVDPQALRQVDEILERFAAASEHVRTVRLDPADPDALGEYEALLTRLQSIYGSRIEVYDRALASAAEAAASFVLFAQKQTAQLARVAVQLPEEDPRRNELQQMAGALQLRLQQAEEVRRARAEALAVDESRPLADYESARSLDAAALTLWADELHRIAQIFKEWRSQESLALEVRQHVAAHLGAYEQMALDLASAADTLKRLEPLEIASIGRSLEQGAAAIVLGPQGARVIAATQLFPALNLRQGDGGVTFDQRFRGEQVIAATIRSLGVDHMPMVVFVHAGDETFMRNRPQNIDLVGVRHTLEASRYDVREWVAGRDARPAPQPGQPAVWVIVPPPVPERRTAVAGGSELALLGAARDLLADGEPVLLNVAPSLASRLGRDDPWRDLLDALGLDSDTSRVLLERTRDGAGNAVTQRVFQVVDYEPGHPVAAAAHGLRTTFDLPVVLELPAEPRPGFTAMVIAAARPSPERWVEAEWMVDPQTLPGPAPQTRLTDPAPLVVAVEKGHPIEPGRRQRAVVVGSGGWPLSYVADLVLGAGGDRAVLLNPGNYELLLASVAWLAGADDLIAAGPVSQQVARLEGLTAGVRTFWQWVTIALLPAACLLAGIGVWLVRR